ncbi:hypothetical protein P7L95_09820 [Bisgaard Taxon 10/6]|uniref:hypothetical protein n=1 Tax=Exercitatus varius TaxID=67857 RepID=UPI00294AE13F|nr:hypothetical protein [Exercitatus varius]MDG2957038.1 hypothetical protein [Exercitatus varius]MDG2965274.1 hypothetical protein [Exercitatus varius]
MEKLGKLDKKAFIKGADNGSIKSKKAVSVKVPSEKNKTRQFVLSLVAEQKAFLDELVEYTKVGRGQLIYQSLLFAKDKPISLDFMQNYINFIYDKRAGQNIQVTKVMDVHDSLKELNNHYKELGISIGIKGVVMLYLLNYAKNYLEIDISRFANFSK